MPWAAPDGGSGEPREKGGGSVTEMSLNGTTKYRISSDPPLNSCIDRLFGKVYDKCVSGGIKDCFYVHTVVKQGLDLLLPIPDEAPPSRLRGVAWRGSDAKGRGFWSVFAVRGVFKGTKEKREPQAQVQFWKAAGG